MSRRAPKLCRFTAELAPSYDPPADWSRCACCSADIRTLSQAEADAGREGRGVTLVDGVVCVECWTLGFRPGMTRERHDIRRPDEPPTPQLSLL